MWKRMTGDYPNPIFIDTADLSAKEVESDMKCELMDKAKESRRKSKYHHQDNSIAARKADAQHDGCIELNDMENDVLWNI